MIIAISLIALAFIIVSIIYWFKFNLIEKELILLGKEQHEQNMEMIKLMKISHEHDMALLMVISHLKQEQPVPFFGTIGEA
jgi:hypothetical protein